MAVWNSVRRSLVLSSFGRLDAEYYHPSNLQAYTKVVKHDHTFVRDIAKAGYRVVYVNTKLTPQSLATPDMPLFVQATNINSTDGEIEFTNCGCAVASDWDSYPRGRIRKGELLIEVKGQAEKVAIVPDYAPEHALISGSLFKLEVDERKISPWFIYIYFCTKYGRILRDRVKTNTLIGFVSKPQLYAIPIVTPKADFQTIIEKMVKDSFLMRRKSRELYSSACSLLSSALKEHELKFDQPLSYTAKFSEVMREGRADADYFQVPYVQLAQKIRGNVAGYGHLTDYCEFLRPNANPDKTPNKEFSYVELADINAGLGVIDACEKYRGCDLPSRARRQVKAGDVLASSVVGSIDKSAVIGKDQENFVASTGFFHLRPNKGVPSEFLLLLMRSTVVQMQLRQQATGGILSSVPDARVKYIIVPNLNRDIQEEIAGKVREAHKKHKESLALLSAAKTRVEELIETEAKCRA